MCIAPTDGESLKASRERTDAYSLFALNRSHKQLTKTLGQQSELSGKRNPSITKLLQLSRQKRGFHVNWVVIVDSFLLETEVIAKAFRFSGPGSLKASISRFLVNI